MLDVGEQLEFLEVLEADTALEAKVNLIITGKKQVMLIFADLQ
jgi:hypothetical protein